MADAMAPGEPTSPSVVTPSVVTPSRNRRDVGHGLPIYKLRYRFKLLLSELESVKDREKAAQAEVNRMQREARENEHKISSLSSDKMKFEASTEKAQLDLQKQMEIHRELAEELYRREDGLRDKISALTQSRYSSLETLKAEAYSLGSSLELKMGELKMAEEKLVSQSSLMEAIEDEADRVQRVVEDAVLQQEKNDDGVQRLKRMLESALDCEELSAGDSSGERIASLEAEAKSALFTITERNREIMFLKSKLEVHEAEACDGKVFSCTADASEFAANCEATIMKEIHDVEEIMSRGQGV